MRQVVRVMAASRSVGLCLLWFGRCVAVTFDVVMWFSVRQYWCGKLWLAPVG